MSRVLHFEVHATYIKDPHGNLLGLLQPDETAAWPCSTDR